MRINISGDSFMFLIFSCTWQEEPGDKVPGSGNAGSSLIRYLFHYQLDLAMPDIVFPVSGDVEPFENLTNFLPVYFRPFQHRETVAIGVVVRNDDSQTPLGRHL